MIGGMLFNQQSAINNQRFIDDLGHALQSTISNHKSAFH
jgi:hypothetical protein